MPAKSDNNSGFQCQYTEMMAEDMAGIEAGTATKNKLLGFFSLLGSGLIAAVGFMLIASRRWPLFDQRLSAFIILFVQWQTLGLTISKLGIENVVFAVVSGDRNKYFASSRFVLRKVVPLAALFSSAVWLVFSPWAALVSFGSILLDAASLIVMADLNARGFYRITSISNLFNYPLFFCILAGLSFLGVANQRFALTAFLVSSLIRWAWLAKNRSVPASREDVSCSVNLEMGMQQVLNYLLFRSDQLLISLLLLTAFAAKEVGVYVYMAKFPEIMASVIVVAGAVYFPELYIQYSAGGKKAFPWINKYLWYVPAYGLLLVVTILIYRRFWNGAPFPFYLVLPFLLHALQVIVVNNVTYSMLRQGYMTVLLRNLAVSVAFGLLYFVVVAVRGIDIYALAWLVPVQMLIFLLLSFCGNWGKKSDLYA